MQCIQSVAAVLMLPDGRAVVVPCWCTRGRGTRRRNCRVGSAVRWAKLGQVGVYRACR